MKIWLPCRLVLVLHYQLCFLLKSFCHLTEGVENKQIWVSKPGQEGSYHSVYNITCSLTLCPCTSHLLYCFIKHFSLCTKLTKDVFVHQFAKFPSLSNMAPVKRKTQLLCYILHISGIQPRCKKPFTPWFMFHVRESKLHAVTIRMKALKQ